MSDRSAASWFAPRRGLAVASSCLVLLVTLAVGVGAFFSRVSGASDFTLDGRTWRYRSDFVGELTFRDPQGHRVGGVVGIGEGQPGSGGVELEVQDQQFRFASPGKHAVRDGSGRLLGFVLLQTMPTANPEEMKRFLAQYGIQEIPQTPEQMREVQRTIAKRHWERWGTQRESGIRGVSDSPLGVLGYDNELGLYWKVRGSVKVSVLAADGTGLGGGETKPSEEPGPETPEVTVLVDGQPSTMRGYGLQEIHSPAGQLLLMLNVEPLAGNAPATTR